jgi:ADP-ribose pyrophosphatase YjhB (NUDIX family)
MQIVREFRKNIFISNDRTLKSFSLRASTIVQVDGKYLMALNEGSNKYKHPGGHIHLNESLLGGLKRELKEEIGLEIEDADTEKIFFDTVFKDGNTMINSLFQIEITSEIAEKILSSSPLPTKLFTVEELNEENTWESEINAIKYYEEHY